MNTANSKGQFRSKAVLGAILTLISAFGLFGINFDPQTMTITINLQDLLDIGLTAAVPGGAALAWFGRVFGRKVIRGLW